MEFNRSAGDLTKLSPLFIDDNRVAEAASIAQKLSNDQYHSLDIQNCKCEIFLPSFVLQSLVKPTILR